MSLTIEVEKKASSIKNIRKVGKPEDIYKLEEIQEIKDAVQEYLLLFCLDNKNNVIKVTLLGKGRGNCVNFEQKEIIRTAILENSPKVILAHNHPSGDCKPSKLDINVTKETSKLLKVFDIELVDHLVVASDNFISMGSENYIKNKINDEFYNTIEMKLLKDENKNLKNEVKELKKEVKELNERIKIYKSIEEEKYEEEKEM